MRLFRAIFLFALVSSWIVRGAAAERLALKSYTTVDGLPSDRINCILRDSHGFLWFGTWDGISRFDGYHFANIVQGLPGPSVNALLETRDGTYWAATVGGLASWNPSRASLSPLVGLRTLPLATGSDPGATALLEDRAGALWIGANSGLYRAERRDLWAPRRIVYATPEPPRSTVSALLEDRSGALWIGTESRLYCRLADGSFTRIATPGGLPVDVRSLLQDRRGEVWIGTHTQGIFLARRESRGWTVRPLSSAADGLAGNYVLRLFQSSDGAVWAACFGGLSEFAPREPPTSRPRTYTTREGLPAIGIFAVGEDEAGNLWIGTDDAGVVRIAHNGFRGYGREDGLSTARLVSLFKNREGRACVFSHGTPSEVVSGTGRLLQCFDGSRFHLARPRIPAGTPFGWGWSQVAFQDSHGEWWIPTFGGLYRFPAVAFPRLAASRPRSVYTTANGLPSNEIFRLHEDSRGDVWMSLSSSDRRLARWVRETESFQTFSPSDGLPVDSPISFADDRSGGLWMGFYEGGIARILDGKLSFFSEKDGVPAGRIRALFVDGQGRLWIGGSRGGVSRIDHPEELPPRARTYTLQDGLSSNNVWSLTGDRWGRIYIGTERGLDRLDPATGVVQMFTTDDGLARGVVEGGLEDGGGDLWFVSAQGLTRLHPEPTGQRSPPAIRIAAVSVGGTRQLLSELGAVRFRLSDLGPAAGPVQIDYFGLDFAAGGAPRYQYRLEGVDTRWSAAIEERSVIYANLRPGSYRFRVRAIGNDGSMSVEPALVDFRILPPFWQRPGFLAAAAAGLMILVYGLHRYRLRGAVALERVRTRIATDLHDDIGSSLSQIAILSEIAQQQSGDGIPRVREVLSRIAFVSRSVVDSLADTIWAIDPQKDRIADLVQRMRRFAGDLLDDQQIELSFQASVDDPGRELASDVRRHLFLIFKEALHNLVRHSGCTRAEIELRVEGRRACLRVSDNGRGFDVGRPRQGYGMSSIRSRASELGGRVEVLTAGSGQSPPGTTLRLDLPLPK